MATRTPSLASSGEPVTRRPKVSIVISRNRGNSSDSEVASGSLPASRLINANSALGLLAAAGLMGLSLLAVQLHADYTVGFQSPVRSSFHSPLVVAKRVKSLPAAQVRKDQQGRTLTSYKQYTCDKIRPNCRVALAVQRAEYPQVTCEVYHHITDVTLDKSNNQNNTKQLRRPGINLRELLDCKANIDFAYQLYSEHHGFTPWAAFNNGKYLRYLRR